MKNHVVILVFGLLGLGCLKKDLDHIVAEGNPFETNLLILESTVVRDESTGQINVSYAIDNELIDEYDAPIWRVIGYCDSCSPATRINYTFEPENSWFIYSSDPDSIVQFTLVVEDFDRNRMSLIRHELD